MSYTYLHHPNAYLKERKVTTQLKSIMESGFDLGLKNYPIFDESYREKLNQKLLNHYRYRQIAYETAGIFKNRLNEAMELIMPYYNQLYEINAIEYDPFINYDYREETNLDRVTNVDGTTNTDITRNEKSNTSENGEQTETQINENLLVRNDTPQTNVTRADLNTGAYASTVDTGDNKTTDEFKNSRTTNGNNDVNENNKGQTAQNLKGNDKTWLTRKGYQNITGSQMFQDAISATLNIDKMIIEDTEIRKLFLTYW